MCYCFTTVQFTNFWILINKRNSFHKANMILIQILLASSKCLHSLQVTGCSFSRLLSSANGRNITTSSKMQIDAFISPFHSYLIWEFSPSFFWQKWRLFFFMSIFLCNLYFPSQFCYFFSEYFAIWIIRTSIIDLVGFFIRVHVQERGMRIFFSDHQY